MILNIIVAAMVILVPGIGSAEGFPATKYPFLPKLTANHEPALCKIFLDHATKQFKSTEPNLAVGEVEHPSVSWIKWEGVWEQVDFKNIPGLTEEQKMDVYRHMVYSNVYLRADLDLDGNGRIKTIVERNFPEGWNKSWRSINSNGYIFKSPKAFMKAVNEAVQRGMGDREDSQGLNMFATATPYSTGMWNGHRLFEYKERFYLLSSGTKGEIGKSFSILRLGGDGATQVMCSIRMIPDELDLPEFLSLPGISSYLQTIRAMGNAGGDDWCGDLDVEGNHDGGAEEAVRRFYYRPWAVARYLDNDRGDQCYRYGPRLEAFIRELGQGNVWSYREYQTSLNHIEPAIQATARFLERNFGVPHSQVAKEARRVVEDLTAAWFVMPKYWSESLGVDITQMAIIKGDVGAVRSFEKQLVAETVNQKRYLLAAVESLPITRILLEHGADPNTRDGFGKTALMYAAQMNRPDVMKELLERKADVHAATEPEYDLGATIEPSAVTALMYAAEHAHPAAMALLVKWGADVNAKDSQGNDVGYYLAKNPLLTPSEREMALPALLESYRDRPMIPSFDCQGVTRKVDRLICGDGILSMQDQAMGKAYRLWLERAPSSDSKKDQVRWVKARDAACADLAESPAVTCLQQWTRARVRYLHNRLAERY